MDESTQLICQSIKCDIVNVKLSDGNSRLVVRQQGGVPDGCGAQAIISCTNLAIENLPSMLTLLRHTPSILVEHETSHAIAEYMSRTGETAVHDSILAQHRANTARSLAAADIDSPALNYYSLDELGRLLTMLNFIVLDVPTARMDNIRPELRTIASEPMGRLTRTPQEILLPILQSEADRERADAFLPENLCGLIIYDGGHFTALQVIPDSNTLLLITGNNRDGTKIHECDWSYATEYIADANSVLAIYISDGMSDSGVIREADLKSALIRARLAVDRINSEIRLQLETAATPWQEPRRTRATTGSLPEGTLPGDYVDPTHIIIVSDDEDECEGKAAETDTPGVEDEAFSEAEMEGGDGTDEDSA
jgi:hypothetical protein